MQLLNQVMTQAPECTEYLDPKTGALEPCGLIGFPINALLDWPMATNSGYAFFANELVNQQFKKILTYWSEYLSSEASRSVLVDNFPERTPKVFGWLSENARTEMISVACQAEPANSPNRQNHSNTSSIAIQVISTTASNHGMISSPVPLCLA
ncbi:phophatidylserine decarboxylase associated domain-containing protein [Plesiomonas shigelloides subsp. oncorhynchi]|nr:phophatidylserine decarboxylase associated domain-containing protein [Plesiomonas shigelloides]